VQNYRSETQLTRLVILDGLIQENSVLLAMTKTRIGAGVPHDFLDSAELSRYTELAAHQLSLTSERSVLREVLVGGPAFQTTPESFAIA
jgi:hypothetical protein